LRTIGVGVIGCGGVSTKYHLPNIRDIPGVELVSVSDVIEEAAKNSATSFGAKHWFTDYKKVLEGREVEAVLICTPPHLHALQALEALELGKHVFCEKPMTIDVKEAEKLVEAVGRTDRKFQVGFMQRFSSAYRKAKEIMNLGFLGKVFMARARAAHPGPGGVFKSTAWAFDRSKSGGGAIINLGIHHLDLLRWFMGDVKSAYCRMYTLVKEIPVEDNALITLEFRNGGVASFEVSWSSIVPFNPPVGHWPVEIYGTDGSISIPTSAGPLMLYQEKDLPQNVRGWVDIPLLYVDMFKQELVDFFDCIRSDREPRVTVEDGKAATDIVAAIYESAEAGKFVNLI